jgi:hypothetical protein
MKHLKTFNESISSNKIIAYHGTPHGKFDKFSMSKRGTGGDVKGTGDYGKGFYFSSDKEYALSYATEVTNIRSDVKKPDPTLYTVELTMNKPFDMRILSKIRDENISLVKKFGFLNVPDIEYEKMFNRLGIDESDYEYYTEIEDLMDDNWGDWDFKKMLNKRGFDSVINYDGKEYIVYDPEQIKIIDINKVS